MTNKALDQIAALRAQLEYHNRKYYVDAAPEVTDREYDQLMQQLLELERSHPELLTADSPSQKVGGAPIEGFQTVEHRVPMLSIDNVFEKQGLFDFDQRLRKLLDIEKIEYTLEYKIDGVALAVIYEQGQLVQAITRGDGQRGDEITHNARTIGGIPLRLTGRNLPTRMEVRGEAFIANSDFARIQATQQAKGEVVFANPRNSTAGALKLLDPKLCAERKVRFFAHGIGDISDDTFTHHAEYIAFLRELGIPTTPGFAVCTGIEAVISQAELMMEQLHTLDVEVDGLVIKVNDFGFRERLGNTSKSPRWVVAYKWERYEAITRVREIQVQVGKTGTLTPVANLEPVEIAGTTVSRSSLHNRDELERLDVKVGDWVVVEKAGKIIPHVVRVLLEKRDGSEHSFLFPELCPECQTSVVQDEGGVYIRCPNPNCPARLRESLRFFASRQALDIEGLGIKLIEQLTAQQLLTSLPDIYRLAAKREELLQLERMGEKSVDNLLQGIEKSKTQPLSRLLTGLNIRHVGVSNARILARRFPSLRQIAEQSVENLAEVREIGPVIAESIYEFFHSDYGTSIVQQLELLGVNLGTAESEVVSTAAETSGILSEKSVVVTGTLQKYTRQAIQELILQLGGKPASSVSARTDYVIAGENAGSKLEKAEKLGIPVLSEVEFEQQFVTKT